MPLGVNTPHQPTRTHIRFWAMSPPCHVASKRLPAAEQAIKCHLPGGHHTNSVPVCHHHYDTTPASPLHVSWHCELNTTPAGYTSVRDATPARFPCCSPPQHDACWPHSRQACESALHTALHRAVPVSVQVCPAVLSRHYNSCSQVVLCLSMQDLSAPELDVVHLYTHTHTHTHARTHTHTYTKSLKRAKVLASG